VQGLLNILKMPYVGSDVLASAVALHKGMSKVMYRSAGLLVPDGIQLARGEEWSYEKISSQLGLPVVIKPVSEGSSIGISICSDKDEVSRGIGRALECDRDILIEEYIDGRELTCCVLGNDVLETLPLIEIIPKKGKFFDYEAKYTTGATAEICPAEVEESLTRKASSCGARAHGALGCSVWSRTDMILRRDSVYVLETNTIPGMTENSLFPLAARAGGMSFSDLLDRLICLSLGKYMTS
jgi:D-alanine-D-alanine ligase